VANEAGLSADQRFLPDTVPARDAPPLENGSARLMCGIPMEGFFG